MINVHKDLAALDDATTAYVKATSSSVLFLIAENEWMAKKMIQNKHTTYLKKEDVKGKSVVQLDGLEGKGKEITLGRPRTRAFKRALNLRKEVSPPNGQINVDDLISRNINTDRVYWLQKINYHLEKLLKKENRDNKL